MELGRRGWNGRTWAVVLAMLALVLTIGWVWHDRSRATAEEALSACTAQAREALRIQDQRFEFMADYLRPALLSLPPEGRDNLYDLMARTAAEAAPRVRDAGAACERVQASWAHPDLRTRRDDLVRHLSETLAVLRTVELDGRRYYEDRPELDAERAALLGVS